MPLRSPHYPNYYVLELDLDRKGRGGLRGGESESKGGSQQEIVFCKVREKLPELDVRVTFPFLLFRTSIDGLQSLCI